MVVLCWWSCWLLRFFFIFFLKLYPVPLLPRRLEKAIEKKADEPGAVPCVYVDSTELNPFVDANKSAAWEGSALWEADGLHMTAAGYSVFGRRLAHVVAQLLASL